MARKITMPNASKASKSVWTYLRHLQVSFPARAQERLEHCALWVQGADCRVQDPTLLNALWWRDSKIPMAIESSEKNRIWCFVRVRRLLLLWYWPEYCKTWSQTTPSVLNVYICTWKRCFDSEYCGCRMHCLYPLIEYCGCSCTQCTHGSYTYDSQYFATILSCLECIACTHWLNIVGAAAPNAPMVLTLMIPSTLRPYCRVYIFTSTSLSTWHTVCTGKPEGVGSWPQRPKATFFPPPPPPKRKFWLLPEDKKMAFETYIEYRYASSF